MQAETVKTDLTRIVRQYTPRRNAFYEYQTGLVSIGGKHLQATPGASISKLLNWAATSHPGNRPHTIWITGGDTAADVPGHNPKDETSVDRFWSAPLSEGWQITSWRRDPFRVAYNRGGLLVEVAMAAAWYGAEHNAVKCDQAHTLLLSMVRHTFDQKATLMSTPGRTGADLLQRSLPAQARYQAMPPAILDVVGDSRNFGQGRIEQPGLYTPNDAGQAPGLYVLDARWMYAAALRHLPIGPVTRDKKHPEYAGYRRALYRIATRVPDDWAHIGLCPQWSASEERTVYPRKPGTYMENCWLTGAELAVLYECGWPVNIQESILYAPQDAPGNDPARMWVDKMMRFREWASLNSQYPGAELVMRAARAMVIQTVGYWHRGASIDTRWLPYGPGKSMPAAAIPADALLVLPLPNGIRYTVKAPLAPATACLYRPEWAVQVWAASRAKLHRAALALDPARIMWLRHDSLVLDSDPEWPDSGKPGSWRVKWAIPHMVKAPLTEAEYRALAKEASI